MANGIYGFEIKVLADKFPLTEKESSALDEICDFNAFFMFRPWFRAPFVNDWAFLDLELDRNLREYARLVSKMRIARSCIVLYCIR